MNNSQISKKNMFNKLLVFFAASANAAVWAAFSRLTEEIAKFVTNNDDLDDYIQAQNLETKGITTQKDAKFITLALLVVKAARKARVWAHDGGHTDLEAQFDVRMDDFTHLAESVGFDKLKNVRDALHTNVGSLAGVNITAGTITAIDTAITAYNNAKGTPGAAKGEKEAGTGNIAKAISDADKNLEIIDDLLVNEYSDTNGTMVAQYLVNREMETVGVHHQGMDAHITFDNAPGDAQGVKMRIVELNKEGVSDILGHVNTLRGKIGTYHVEFSGDGIVTKTIIASIKRGEVLHLAVQVTKL